MEVRTLAAEQRPTAAVGDVELIVLGSRLGQALGGSLYLAFEVREHDATYDLVRATFVLGPGSQPGVESRHGRRRLQTVLTGLSCDLGRRELGAVVFGSAELAQERRGAAQLSLQSAYDERALTSC